jgi:hypothetical protein
MFWAVNQREFVLAFNCESRASLQGRIASNGQQIILREIGSLVFSSSLNSMMIWRGFVILPSKGLSLPRSFPFESNLQLKVIEW